VSAIGRQCNTRDLPFLIKASEDLDPKVVLQAIRALLKQEKQHDVDIKDTLQKLSEHDNEMIRYILATENHVTVKSRQSHADVYKSIKNVIVHGNVVEVLRKIPEPIFHLTFTSLILIIFFCCFYCYAHLQIITT
jgi:hypothetical protein